MTTTRARIRTTAIAAGAVGVELRSGATRGFTLAGMIVSALAATVLTFGVNRRNALGITPGTTTTPVPSQASGRASGITIAQTWGTAPTIAAGAYFVEWTVGATIGAGIILPLEIECDASDSLLIVNLGAAAWPITGMSFLFNE
jgi:hypothetical protein